MPPASLSILAVMKPGPSTARNKRNRPCHRFSMRSSKGDLRAAGERQAVPVRTAHRRTYQNRAIMMKRRLCSHDGGALRRVWANLRDTRQTFYPTVPQKGNVTNCETMQQIYSPDTGSGSILS